MRIVYMYLVFFCLISVISCEKEISVDLPTSEEKPVIEGKIENGDVAQVILTRNAPYFEPIPVSLLLDLIPDSIKEYLEYTDSATFQALKEVYVPGNVDTTARIIVTEVSSGLKDTLMLVFNPYKTPFYMYQGSKLIGKIGRSYSLKVETHGKEYTAITTIPEPVPLDSIKFKLSNDSDSTGFLWIYGTDPEFENNYYRIFTKTVGKDIDYVRPGSSIFDDQFLNGSTFEFAVSRGWNPTLGEVDTSQDVPWWSFVLNETVKIKFSSLDAEHYDFWNSIEQQNATEGNPFASPTAVRTNISGGAIGIWGGYGVSIHEITIDSSKILKAIRKND